MEYIARTHAFSHDLPARISAPVATKRLVCAVESPVKARVANAIAIDLDDFRTALISDDYQAIGDILEISPAIFLAMTAPSMIYDN